MPDKLPALPWVRAGLSQGLSGRAALANYREAAADAGLSGMRTHDFQRLYSELDAIRGQAGEALDAPKDIPGGGLEPKPWSTQRGITGFGHWVSIYQVERQSGALIHMPYLIKSDQPLTPAQAEQQALDYLNTQPDNYDRRTIGVTFSGFAKFGGPPGQYEDVSE